MRKHAIVIICVMLSFCLHANFPEISGGARGEAGGGRLPLIFRPNRGPKGRKKFSQTAPPPLSQGLYDRTPLHLSEDLDPLLEIIT